MTERKCFWELDDEKLDLLASMYEKIADSISRIPKQSTAHAIESLNDPNSSDNVCLDPTLIASVKAVANELKAPSRYSADAVCPLFVSSEELSDEQLVTLTKEMARWLRLSQRASTFNAFITNLIWSAKNAKRLKEAIEMKRTLAYA